MFADKWGRMFWGYSIRRRYLSHTLFISLEHAEEFISTAYCFMSCCIYISAHTQPTVMQLFNPFCAHTGKSISFYIQHLCNVLFTVRWFQHNTAEVLMFLWKLKHYDMLHKYQRAVSIPVCFRVLSDRCDLKI